MPLIDPGTTAPDFALPDQEGTTYLIGTDGTVARRWDNVRVAGHVDEVIRAVSDLAAAH